jgi:hypothetical protein
MKARTLLLLIPFAGFISCCTSVDPPSEPVSDTGVTKASATIDVGSDGLTTEQRNVKARLEEDNKIGSIKHLYIISAYSGQVLVYSTVDGKVTSSGKRLTPTTVVASRYNGYDSSSQGWNAFKVNIGGKVYRTTEVLQDDGTYGTSIPYLFWTDAKGVYHQHYISGGQIIHISNEPLAVKNVVINMALTE